MNMRVWVCMYTFIYVCLFVCVHLSLCQHIKLCVCVCLSVCVYILSLTRRPRSRDLHVELYSVHTQYLVTYVRQRVAARHHAGKGR